MSKNLDQDEVLQLLHTERNQISKLQMTLAATGQTVRPFVLSKESENDILLQLDEARKESALLDNLISRAPKAAAIPATPRSAAPEAEGTQLTAAEMNQLTWTDRIRLAQGVLTIGQARAEIAKENVALKTASLTEQCRTAKQAETNLATTTGAPTSGKTLTELCLTAKTK